MCLLSVKVAKVIVGPVSIAFTLPALLRVDFSYSRQKSPAHWTSTGMTLDVGLLLRAFSMLAVIFGAD